MDESRDEMNSVCRAAADMATELLEDNGSIVPFALAVLADGELEMVAPGEAPVDADEALDDVRNRLRSGAEENLYRAAAVVSDVRIKAHDSDEIADALRVEVEHVSHSPFTCFFPYKQVGDKYEHGQGHLESGQSLVFTQS